MVGAFNAWLALLVEFGVVGTVITLIVFLLPLPIAWISLSRESNITTILAFGFALSAVAISIHLFFITLMYSFAWVHIGIALAAGRLGLESSASTKIMENPKMMNARTKYSRSYLR